MSRQGEDRKPGVRKRAASKSKRNQQEPGVWPCKLNGCNKRFAREADLKRHQRTTKLHSSPSLYVACAQCEATFTRTDALRRHQKSRHNGLILAPVDPTLHSDEQMEMGGSAIQSRTGTPNRSASTSLFTYSPSIATPIQPILPQSDALDPSLAAQSDSHRQTLLPTYQLQPSWYYTS